MPQKVDFLNFGAIFGEFFMSQKVGILSTAQWQIAVGRLVQKYENYGNDLKWHLEQFRELVNFAGRPGHSVADPERP